MKKYIIITAFFAFVSATAFAQIVKPTIIKKNIEPVKTLPPAPAPAPIYSLAAVKVNIRTGSDNKEFPSPVIASLVIRNNNGYKFFKQENLKNEMKVNSNTEFGLEKTSTATATKELTLDDLQTAGIEFKIRYTANFQFDAWKIEGITLTLEFRDQNGNLHPTMGQKIITFSNAQGFLNGYFERSMTCTTDGYFNPLSAQIGQ